MCCGQHSIREGFRKVGMIREGRKRKILPIRGEWVDNYFYSIFLTLILLRLQDNQSTFKLKNPAKKFPTSLIKPYAHNLKESFGDIDIYLFDQLLKGRFDDCKNVIDIGCGSGRNIVYFLRNGFNVYAIDQDARAVESVKTLSKQLAPGTPPDHLLSLS